LAVCVKPDKFLAISGHFDMTASAARNMASNDQFFSTVLSAFSAEARGSLQRAAPVGWDHRRDHERWHS